MEKRVERNKELYKKIAKEIASSQKRNDNLSFDKTNETLSNINPDLFDDVSNKNKNEIKSEDSFLLKYKKHLITAIIFILVIIIIIILAVILNGK